MGFRAEPDILNPLNLNNFLFSVLFMFPDQGFWMLSWNIKGGLKGNALSFDISEKCDKRKSKWVELDVD